MNAHQRRTAARAFRKQFKIGDRIVHYGTLYIISQFNGNWGEVRIEKPGGSARHWVSAASVIRHNPDGGLR